MESKTIAVIGATGAQGTDMPATNIKGLLKGTTRPRNSLQHMGAASIMVILTLAALALKESPIIFRPWN